MAVKGTTKAPRRRNPPVDLSVLRFEARETPLVSTRGRSSEEIPDALYKVMALAVEQGQTIYTDMPEYAVAKYRRFLNTILATEYPNENLKVRTSTFEPDAGSPEDFVKIGFAVKPKPAVEG